MTVHLCPDILRLLPGTWDHFIGNYHLAIDGPTFRSQRKLLLKLQGLAAGGIPNVPDPGDRELLEGLLELTDELADQAHDKHGVDCLLDAGE